MRRFNAISPSRLLGRLALVAALIGLTTVVLRLAQAGLNTPIVALLFLVPVVLSTTLGGLGLGIATSVAAFLAFNYFFIPPYYTLFIHQTEDVLALVVFLVVAIVVSELVGRAQASLAQAQARERETTQLYELSTALVGLREAEAIARVLAERVRDSFDARRVEVEVQAGAEQ